MYQQPTGISAKLRTMRMMFFMTGIGISVWAIVVPFTKIRFQLSDGTLGLMLLAGGTGGMLVMPFAGMAIGRWGSRAVLIAVGLTFGQQSWLRLLNIDHHQVMAGTSGSMAPGFETAEALAKSKSAPGYWAKKQPASKKNAA